VQHARPRGRRVARIVALAATGVLVLGVAGAGAAYLRLKSDIKVSDVDSLLADRTDRPTQAPANPDDPFAGKALNILVMGTDFRGGDNAKLAGAGDQFHSDSTLVVHISGDRTRMEVVSIPRDSLVPIPACPLGGGRTSRPHTSAMFNDAFTIGGGPKQDVTGAAACTILTVEKLTGVPITDHIVANMSGVVGVVDAVGGVTMCLPEPVIGNHNVDLDLPAGRQKLDGYKSINFLRARKGHGMGLQLGSDLERIKRQQAFFDAMVREILAQNLITDSPRLYRVVEAVLKSISTDPELADPRALAGLAWSVRAIDPADIVFTELPVAPAPTDSNRVVWVTSKTDPIWKRIAQDDPPPGPATSKPKPTSSSTAAAGGSSSSPSGGKSTSTKGTGGTHTPTATPSVLPGVCR
jgi:LCP family protein required for cell wall assembly